MNLFIKSEDEEVRLENPVLDWGHPWVGGKWERSSCCLTITQELMGPILLVPRAIEHNVSHLRAPVCLPT